MTTLQKAILATIIYYDTIGFPLTSREIGRYLIALRRMAPGSREDALVTIENINAGLEQLQQEGKIAERRGFYFLPGQSALFQERMERNKLAELKWRKARRYLFWIQLLPFIEGVLVSGSLALGHANEESDLDILVIAKKGRIWTARLLVLLLYGLTGVRRRHGDTNAPDKICPNHFITTASLHIPYPSLYNAQTYLHLVPVYVRQPELINDFWEANRWINRFVHFDYCSFSFSSALSAGNPLGNYHQRAVSPRWFLSLTRQLAEVLLERMCLANALERLAKTIQAKRINQNLPGRVNVSDEQLEFHPFSVEAKILSKFNQAIMEDGNFGRYAEFDSGLK